MKATIIGTGPIGRHSASYLLQRGWTVQFVNRSGASVDGIDAPVVRLDARRSEDLCRSCAGSDVVLFCASVPYHLWATEQAELQTAALDAAEKTGARIALVENLYAYDYTAQPLTARSPLAPRTRKGKIRLEQSRQWERRHEEGRIRAVAVRGSDYYGPGATWQSAFGDRFLPALSSGKSVAMIGDPEKKHAFTYVKDFARALVDAALDDAAYGRAWIAPTADALTLRETAELFFRRVGRRDTIKRLPNALLSFLGIFNPMIKEVVEMTVQYDIDYRVDSSEFERRFGWKATPLDVGVEETLAAFRAARA